MRKNFLRLLEGVLFSLPMLFASCGNGDNALEEIINGGGSGGGLGETIVKYKAYNSESGSFEEKQITVFTLITSSSTTLEAGTYVVEGNVTIDGNVIIGGEIELILSDGATLTINGDFSSGGDSSAKIYGQSSGTGKLIVNTTTDELSSINLKDLVMNGGEIEVNCTGNETYGINTGGDFYMYGGKITATATKRAINIQSGCKFYMVGGEVNVTGTSYTETGGAVRGGWGINGEISMTGGTFTAQGGDSGAYDATTGCEGGVGINGNISINGGTLSTYGGKGGPGSTTNGPGGYGACATVTYSGGKVISIGGEYGTGSGSNGNGQCLNQIVNETGVALQYDYCSLPMNWASAANAAIPAGSHVVLGTEQHAARIPHE